MFSDSLTARLIERQTEAEQSRERIPRSTQARRPLLLPRRQRQGGERVERRGQTRVLLIPPRRQPAVTPSDRHQIRDLLIADLCRHSPAHTDPVHETVPTQVERALTRLLFDRRVDLAAVPAGKPRPPRRTTRSVTKADDAQIPRTGDVTADPDLRGVLTRAGLPSPPRLRTPEPAAGDVHAQFLDALTNRHIASAETTFSHESPFRRHRGRAPTTCTPCVPALPLGHRAGVARLPGRRARYPNSRPLVSYSQGSERVRQLPPAPSSTPEPQKVRSPSAPRGSFLVGPLNDNRIHGGVTEGREIRIGPASPTGGPSGDPGEIPHGRAPLPPRKETE